MKRYVFYPGWRAFYTTDIWMVVHMLSTNNHWSKQQCIVVAIEVTTNIYVIQWDVLSYYAIDRIRIRLHIVILYCKWLYIRDSSRSHRTVHWTRTGPGAIGCTNVENVLNKIARIVTAQTAHLIGNFIHLCGNPMISVKNTANPCGVRVSRGWNRGIHCHNTVESP